MVPLLFPALAQSGLGLLQMIRGFAMNPQRPVYGIPQEVQDNLSQNQINLNARSAAAGRAEEQIMQSQASTIQNAAQSGGGVANQLLAGAMAQANTNRGLQNLSAGEREDYQRRLGALGQSQSQMAQYRDKAFDYNQAQPFQDAAATKSALIEGGIQNTYGGLRGLSMGMMQGRGQGVPQQTQSPFWIPQRQGLMFDNRDMPGSGVYQSNYYGNIG